mmetsp:Transcript_68991/g.166850  ORF Transcript_68991/g.166850 Transcript_68991/m.166850 type:complete len:217 (+) Transcript_68991:236-886(+)
MASWRLAHCSQSLRRREASQLSPATRPGASLRQSGRAGWASSAPTLASSSRHLSASFSAAWRWAPPMPASPDCFCGCSTCRPGRLPWPWGRGPCHPRPCPLPPPTWRLPSIRERVPPQTSKTYRGRWGRQRRRRRPWGRRRASNTSSSSWTPSAISSGRSSADSCRYKSGSPCARRPCAPSSSRLGPACCVWEEPKSCRQKRLQPRWRLPGCSLQR